jgi:hypothetical protein
MWGVYWLPELSDSEALCFMESAASGLLPRLLELYLYSRGWNGSVGIATSYGLDGPGIKSLWRLGFSHPSRPALGFTQTPIQCIPGLFSRGKKALTTNLHLDPKLKKE